MGLVVLVMMIVGVVEWIYWVIEVGVVEGEVGVEVVVAAVPVECIVSWVLATLVIAVWIASAECAAAFYDWNLPCTLHAVLMTH